MCKNGFWDPETEKHVPRVLEVSNFFIKNRGSVFNQNFFLKCLILSQDYNPKFFKKTGDYELDPKLLTQTSSYSI